MMRGQSRIDHRQEIHHYLKSNNIMSYGPQHPCLLYSSKVLHKVNFYRISRYDLFINNNLKYTEEGVDEESRINMIDFLILY